MSASLRALRRTLVAAVLFSSIAFPVAAHAIGTSTSITRGVVGYGTVHVDTTATTPPDECTSAASNPGGTSANVNAGTESDCSSITGSSYDHCMSVGTDGSFSCSITLEAQLADSSGWRFDHWSGDCSGTTTSCTLHTRDKDCSDLPCTTDNNGPFTAVAHFVDTRAPTTSYSTAPSANAVIYSDTQSQMFTWSTNEDAESPFFACKKDAGTFSACSSGFTWSSIADGIHDFCVHGSDASGLQGADVCRHWEQETNPTASISTHPASTTGTPDASFTYTSNKASHPADGSTLSYQCELDGGSFAACPASGKSYSLLQNGQHNFQVKAVFTAALGGGAHTSTAASYTWTQADTTGPTVTLASSPDGTVNISGDHTATISWTGDEPTQSQTFECELDSGGFHTCSSPMTLTGLSDGIHDFRIRGTNYLNNTGPTKVVHWDQETPPTAAFTGGPPEGSSVASRSSTFSFSSPNPSATFECSLDGGAYAPCSSPYALTVPSDGSHTLSVRASFTSVLDGSKHTGDAVSRTWTVNTPSAGGSGGGGGTISPRLAAPQIAASWKRSKHYKRLSALTVLNVPAGSTVTLTCKGKRHSCPFKRKVIHVRTDTAKLSLSKYFKKAKLKKGTVIQVKVTKPGMTAVDRRLKA